MGIFIRWHPDLRIAFTTPAEVSVSTQFLETEWCWIYRDQLTCGNVSVHHSEVTLFITCLTWRLYFKRTASFAIGMTSPNHRTFTEKNANPIYFSMFINNRFRRYYFYKFHGQSWITRLARHGQTSVLHDLAINGGQEWKGRCRSCVTAVDQFLHVQPTPRSSSELRAKGPDAWRRDQGWNWADIGPSFTLYELCYLSQPYVLVLASEWLPFMMKGCTKSVTMLEDGRIDKVEVSSS